MRAEYSSSVTKGSRSLNKDEDKPILYISYDGLTDPLGQSQILPYLLRLSEKGFSFHILSFEKSQNFKEGKVIIESLIVSKDITWHPRVYHKYPAIISAIFDLINMRNKAKKLHRKYRFSASWCRSYLPAIVGLYLKRKMGLPFIFDMRGFWADERVEGGSWPQSKQRFRLVFEYFKKKEMELLKSADHIVVLTKKAKNLLISGQFGPKVVTPIAMVPCCVDTDHFNPSGIENEVKIDTRRRLGIGASDKVLVYAGSLGTWYMMPDMLKYFFDQWQKDNTWKFLVVTKDDVSSLIRIVESLGLDSGTVIHVAADRISMPLYLSIADLAISFISPTFSKQASSPTKLAEYMAMGLASVCNRGVGDVDEIILESGAGVLVDNHLASFETGIADKKAIRQYAVTHFSLVNGVSVYESILSKF